VLELVLAAAGSVAGTLPQEQPPLEFGTDVRMIRLDVSVVDGQGRPVAGLSPAAFEVFEDGKPVPITLFETIQEGTAQTAASILDGGLVVTPPPRPLERRILLLVDTATLSPPQLQRARDGAAQFLREAAVPGDWVRLVNLASGEAWDGTMPADRAALVAVARGLLPRASPWTGPTRPEGIVETAETLLGPASETATRGQFLSIFSQTAGLLGTLESLLLELDGVEGRKALVLVSPGFPQLIDFERRLQEVASLARLAATTIYFVDAVAFDDVMPEAGRRLGSAFETAWDRSGGAIDLAEATGGFTSRFSNSLLPALSRIGGEMRSYYVLGYVPPRPDDGKFRAVKVKVSARGATARTKKGYLAGRRP
jgi:VWFA-related protein